MTKSECATFYCHICKKELPFDEKKTCLEEHNGVFIEVCEEHRKYGKYKIQKEDS